MTQAPTNDNAWLDAWAPERDQALRELDREFGALKQAHFAQHGPNASTPYQLTARDGEALFARMAQALRERVRTMLPDRPNVSPAVLATFVLSPLEQSCLGKLQALVQTWQTRGAANLAYVQAPVDAAKHAVRQIAGSIRDGITEDARADQGHRHAVAIAAQAVPAAVARDDVITIHGIRTRGEWQKLLTPVLNRGGLDVTPRDYGRVGVFPFLRKASREKQIERFKNEYLTEFGSAEKPPHLIAHSYGTYIAAEAMRKYPEIRFRRIVLCGAIIECGYPWETLKSNGQVEAVLNELGGRDWEVKLAQWGVPDAGPSGRVGFTEPGSVVTQNLNVHFKHSDAMYPERTRQRWLPFLRGEAMRMVTALPPAKPNLRNSFVRWASLIVLVLLAYLCYERLSSKLPAQRPAPAANSEVALTPHSVDASSRPAIGASSKRDTPSALERQTTAPSNPDRSKAPSGDATGGLTTKPAPTPVPAPRKDSAQGADTTKNPNLKPPGERSAPSPAPPNDDADESSTRAAPSSSRSEADALFVKTMKAYDQNTMAVREAIVWLVSLRKSPLSCDAYLEFVRGFGTTDHDRSAFDMHRKASRNDVIRETVYYVDTSAPGCMTALMELATESTTTHVLLGEQDTPASETMAQRRRKHAGVLVHEMDELLLLLDNRRLNDVDPILFGQANYLAFMATAVINTHTGLAPGRVDPKSFDPWWRPRLRGYVQDWRTQTAAVAAGPCPDCGAGATKAEGSAQ